MPLPIVPATLMALARRLPPALLTQSVHPSAGQSLAGSVARHLMSPLRSVDVTIPHGECAGLRFNAGGSAPSFALGTSEPEVQAALARSLRAGHVFYDIGANVGFYTVLAARRVGGSGHVYAFEPVPGNVAALCKNIELSGFTGVTVFPVAAANQRGLALMALSREPFWGRLSHLPPPPRAAGTLTVKSIRVDELVASGEARPPDVVKIDVEGAEDQVLAGMRETLHTLRPVIVCELHEASAEVVRLLESAAYSVRPLWRTVRGRVQRSRHVIATPGPRVS